MSVSAVSCQGVAQAPFPPPPDVRRGGPDGLAKALGVTGADLRSAREQGQTLAQFAESKGISRDDLIAAVTSTMPKDGPAGASAVSDADLTGMASEMIDRAPGRDGPHGRPPGGADDARMMPSRELLDRITAGDVGEDDVAAFASHLSTYSASLSDAVRTRVGHGSSNPVALDTHA